MLTPRVSRHTIYLPGRDAAARLRAIEIWLSTGSVPVAHIVAEPDPTEEGSPMHQPIAA